MITESAAELTIARTLETGAVDHQARCTGAWTVGAIAGLEGRVEALPWPRTGTVVIDATGISVLDTSDAWLLHRTTRELEAQGISVRVDGLRPEFASYLQLIASRSVVGTT